MRIRWLWVAAVLLLLASVALGATAAGDWWGRTREVRSAQHRLSQHLDEQWAAGRGGIPEVFDRGPARMPLGGDPVTGAFAGPVARLHLPTIEADLVVLGGVSAADLRLGPGYIPGTAPIGAAGNTGIAGERLPGVFWDLDRLGIGDPVVLETSDTWFVYRVMEARVVRPEENAVLGPPPPGAGPLLTLVTCEPRLSTARRLIRQATLVRRDPRTGPRPVELA
ncbi:class E sortase [Dactylosporangium sp. CA-233914]|uniref:class E sortase n=1 Tax=Dactylosporangium sp. CA-233914 TaxID=3239934 RepID=UPI003D94E3A4